MPIQARNGDGLIVQDSMGRTLVIQDSMGQVVSHVAAPVALVRDAFEGYPTQHFQVNTHPGYATRPQDTRDVTSWQGKFYVRKRNTATVTRFNTNGTPDGIIVVAPAGEAMTIMGGDIYTVEGSDDGWIIRRYSLLGVLHGTVQSALGPNLTPRFMTADGANLIIVDTAVGIHTVTTAGLAVPSRPSFSLTEPGSVRSGGYWDGKLYVVDTARAAFRYDMATRAYEGTLTLAIGDGGDEVETFAFVRGGDAADNHLFVSQGNAARSDVNVLDLDLLTFAI